MNQPTPQDDSPSQGSGPPSKKPRTSTPKVKTGCVTCKRRRVKCDETKPQCLRCANFGRVCGGYVSKEDKPSPKETSPPVPRKLLSKAMQAPPSIFPAGSSSSTSHFTFAPPSLPNPPQISTPLPPGVTFQDEKDYRYFCHFRDVTSLELSAGFDATLWNKTVIQACDNVSIRQLTIAVAALHIAVANGSSNLAAAPSCPDRQYALKLYGDAIKGIRQMVSGGQDTLRVALISALLTFCFERLHGGLKQAVMQVQSPIEMIVKWLSNTPMPYRLYRLGSRKGKEVRPIEDNLLMAFVRLDRPSLALASGVEGMPPMPGNRIFPLLFKNPLDISGNSFETIEEARTYLEDICWRILPNYNVSSTTDTSVFPNLDSIQTLLRDWNQSGAFFGSSYNLSFQLAQWHDAFSQLLNFGLSTAGESIFVAAVTLHVQALALDIFLNGAASKPHTDSRSSSISDSRSPPMTLANDSGSSSSSLALPLQIQSRKPSSTDLPSQKQARKSSSTTDMQAYLDVPGPSSGMTKPPESAFPLVKAILDFSRRLVAHPSFKKEFVFEVGIIPRLVDAVLHCPDRELKLEAVDVLRSMGPRKEGIWDAQSCADAAEKSIAKEDSLSGADLLDPLLFDSV